MGWAEWQAARTHLSGMVRVGRQAVNRHSMPGRGDQEPHIPGALPMASHSLAGVSGVFRPATILVTTVTRIVAGGGCWDVMARRSGLR